MLRSVSASFAIAAVLVANAPPACGQDTVGEFPLASPAVVVPASQASPEPTAPSVQPLSVAEPPTIHEQRTGLLVAGTIVFALVYGVTLTGAIISWDGIDGPCSDCHSQSLLWSIPVAGPWAANLSAPPDERVSTWFVAAWSGIEAASLAMIIVGAIGHDVPQEPLPATPTKVSLVPLLTPQGGALSFRMRW
jgi:hypothetical protein